MLYMPEGCFAKDLLLSQPDQLIGDPGAVIILLIGAAPAWQRAIDPAAPPLAITAAMTVLFDGGGGGGPT